MLEDNDRTGLFHELHRSVEVAATDAVEQLMAEAPSLNYPPNHGFLADEVAALKMIPKTPAMERALRILIASAAATSVFDLLCLADGVMDPPEIPDLSDEDRNAEKLMMHDGFYDSYWSWRRRRPDPGWRLDTYEG